MYVCIYVYVFRSYCMTNITIYKTQKTNKYAMIHTKYTHMETNTHTYTYLYIYIYRYNYIKTKLHKHIKYKNNINIYKLQNIGKTIHNYKCTYIYIYIYICTIKTKPYAIHKHTITYKSI